MKKNFEPAGNILNKVLQLKPTWYHYKLTDDLSPKSFGFIAQDVQPIFPEFVDEKEGYLSLGYQGFTVASIAAIQEMHKIITTQQTEINDLKDRINELHSAIQDLQQ